jgi:phosphate transport system substrate-binding protein
MKVYKVWWKWLVPAILLFFISCKSGSDGTAEVLDRFNRGAIHISCDETFKPVIDEQVRVYEDKYPETKIIVHYKPEADCLRDLLVDSIRMIIVTRQISADESKAVVDSLKTVPDQRVVARDLVAVVVNKAAGEKFFTMDEIKNLLTGKSKENLIPVFDGLSATSTVRFMLDSVLQGDSLSKNVQAAKSSVEVIEYVKKVPNAVGFVGYSWIGSRDDSLQSSQRKSVGIAYIESTNSAGAYVQPAQYFIYTSSYPMVRDLVYVVKERHEGLGHAFARFLESDRGQLIFRRAFIMPVLKPNYIRDVKLNENINNP